MVDKKKWGIRIFLLGILLVSIALHFYFLIKNPGVSFNRIDVFNPSHVKEFGTKVLWYASTDGINYAREAHQFLQSGILGFNSTTPNAYVTPGQPLYLALLFWIAEKLNFQEVWSFRTANMILGVATVFILYKIGKNAFNNWVGLVAAAMYTIYFPPYHYFRSTLSEIPSIFFLLLALYLAILAFKQEKYIYHMLFGLMFSIALMFRPNGLPFLVPLLLYVLLMNRRDVKQLFKIALLWAVGPVLIILPWVIRNEIVLHKLILFSSQTNPLIAGLNPFYLQSDQALEQAFTASNQSAGAFAIHWVLQGIKNDPSLWLSWFTTGKFVILFGRPSAINEYTFAHATEFVLYHQFILVIGLLTAYVARKQTFILLLGSGVWCYIGFTLLFVPTDRYGFYTMPVIMLLASYGLCEALARIKTKLKKKQQLTET